MFQTTNQKKNNEKSFTSKQIGSFRHWPHAVGSYISHRICPKHHNFKQKSKIPKHSPHEQKMFPTHKCSGIQETNWLILILFFKIWNPNIPLSYHNIPASVLGIHEKTHMKWIFQKQMIERNHWFTSLPLNKLPPTWMTSWWPSSPPRDAIITI